MLKFSNSNVVNLAGQGVGGGTSWKEIFVAVVKNNFKSPDE